MMRLNSNASVREIITAGVLSALLDGGFVTLYLLILFAISVPIAIVAMTLGALQAAIVLLTWRRQREFMSANLQTQAAAQDYQFEMLTGMETLKAMGVEQAAVDRWSNLFVDVLNVSIARGRLGALIEATTSALRLGSPLLILGFGGLKVLNGDLTLGTMLAVSAVAEGFLSPLATLVMTAGQFQLLGSYIERLDDVLDASPEQDKSKARQADRLRGQVRLEQVCFRYGKIGPARAPGCVGGHSAGPARRHRRSIRRRENRRLPACSSVCTRRSRAECCTTVRISPNWICARSGGSSAS